MEPYKETILAPKRHCETPPGPFFCYAHIPIGEIPVRQLFTIVYEKKCTRCKKSISITSFSIRKKKKPTKSGWYYMASWCDDCTKKYSKEWKTPERIKKVNDKIKNELTDGYIVTCLKRLKYYSGYSREYFYKNPNLILGFREYLTLKRKGLAKGQKYHNHKPWTSIEVNILKTLYVTHTCPQLSIILNRSLDCIYSKVKRLKEIT